MLKIKSHKGTVDYKTSGDEREIMADLMCAINTLYKDFYVNGNGDSFKSFLTMCVNDGSAFTEDGNPAEEGGEQSE